MASFTLYYYQPTGEKLSAGEVKSRVGIDPQSYGSDGLVSLGVYPLLDEVQPFNAGIYDLAQTVAIVGNNAEQSWTTTAKELKTVRDTANKQRAQTAIGRINNLSEEAGFGPTIFSAVISLPQAQRAMPFADWVTRQEEAVTELANDVATINAATSADDINDVVSAAWGFINIGYDPNQPTDLLASDFVADGFYSKNYAEADLELYFPQTTTTLAYSGGFAATSNAFTSGDHSVQLRVASTGVVIDEFRVPASTTVVEVEFGYRKYEQLSTLS